MNEPNYMRLHLNQHQRKWGTKKRTKTIKEKQIAREHSNMSTQTKVFTLTNMIENASEG